MTREDYAKLAGPCQHEPSVAASELEDQTDRTLLWGYTCDRDSWHVFLRHGELEHVVYKTGREIFAHARAVEMGAASIVPNKRLYPEACDFRFCQLLESKGVWLPFTSFNPARKPIQFHGLVPPLPSPSTVEAGR